MSRRPLAPTLRRALAIVATGAVLAGTGTVSALAEGGDDHSAEGLVLRGPTAAGHLRAQVMRSSVFMPTPTPARPLPARLDLRPTYQAAVTCDPVDRVGTVRLGRMLVDTYGTGIFGVSRYCDGTLSEHHEGRAVDWMLDVHDPQQKAVAESFLAWLTANGGEKAARLGIQYVIWNRTMWRAYAPERGFAPYHGVSPHTDHIHLSLTWDGAMARTSWWTGTPVTTRDVGPCRVYAGQPAPLYTQRRTTPCPTWLPAPPPSPYPMVAIGSRDRTNVVRGQQALGITADGVFGRGTQKAVLDYQRAHGLPTSGAFDKPTWNRLLPASAPVTPSPVTPSPVTPSPAPPPSPAPIGVPTPPRSADTATVPLPRTVTRPLSRYKKTVLRPGDSGATVRALQRALRLRVTGRMDAPTVTAVKGVQARWRLSRTGTVDAKTWNRVELTRYPWLGYTGRTLRRGAAGPAVVALQKALRVGADGHFGPATERAVRALQTRYGLTATGIVDPAAWRAISHAAR